VYRDPKDGERHSGTGAAAMTIRAFGTTQWAETSMREAAASDVRPRLIAKPARRKELDVLRAVAVLLVLGRHLKIDDASPMASAGILAIWGRCGWVGVDLFFVLSGFLVSGLIFQEYRTHGTFDFKRFFIRRAFKIYPGFYALILLTPLMSSWAKRSLAAREYLSEVFFVQNYAYPIWPHTWSLGVEEQFYLAIGLLLLVLSLRGKADPFAACPWIFLTVAALSLGCRVVTSLSVPYSLQTNVTPGHLRIDSLLFGVLLSYFHHFRPDRVLVRIGRHRGNLLVGSALLIAPCLVLPLSHTFMHTIGFTFLYLGFGGILVVSLRERRGDASIGLLGSSLAVLGAYSYSIYLWHIPVRRVVAVIMHRALASGPSAALVEMGLYVSFSIGVGIVMAKLIEVPCLAFRDAIVPSRAPRMAVVAPIAHATARS
jgi:peptidoglycan/LPS O-acetylase OafA/YrhL